MKHKFNTEAEVNEAMHKLNLYFVDRILNGTYTVRKSDKHCVDIIIKVGAKYDTAEDGLPMEKEYRFAMWIANGQKSFRGWKGDSDFPLHFTDDEKAVLWPKFHNRFVTDRILQAEEEIANNKATTEETEKELLEEVKQLEKTIIREVTPEK